MENESYLKPIVDVFEVVTNIANHIRNNVSDESANNGFTQDEVLEIVYSLELIYNVNIDLIYEEGRTGRELIAELIAQIENKKHQFYASDYDLLLSEDFSQYGVTDLKYRNPLELSYSCESAYPPYYRGIHRRLPLEGHELWCFSPYRYETPIREVILRFKLHGDSFLSEFLAWGMAKCMDEMNLDADYLIPVPISETRLMERGFNQAELLCRELFNNRGCRVLEGLTKNTDAEHQQFLGVDSRKRNVKASISCNCPEMIKGKKIIIIDDICTTGSTLKECARVLFDNGAQEVSALTCASSSFKDFMQSPRRQIAKAKNQ